MIVKIIEVIGTSGTSFEDAAQQAVTEASKTIRGITGVDIISQKATVESGKITEYRVVTKLAFPVER